MKNHELDFAGLPRVKGYKPRVLERRVLGLRVSTWGILALAAMMVVLSLCTVLQVRGAFDVPEAEASWTEMPIVEEYTDQTREVCAKVLSV